LSKNIAGGRAGRFSAVAGGSRLQHGVGGRLHLLLQAGELCQYFAQLRLALSGLGLAWLGWLTQLLLLVE